MRGKYKQLFLRVLDDGQHVCQPANLKVTPERTLEIFVEDVSWISCPTTYLCREPPAAKRTDSPSPRIPLQQAWVIRPPRHLVPQARPLETSLRPSRTR